MEDFRLAVAWFAMQAELRVSKQTGFLAATL